MAVVRSRRAYAAAALGAILITVACIGPASAQSTGPEPAPLSPGLAEQLAAAAPTSRHQVMIHAVDLAAADRAIAATGMIKGVEFRGIGVITATATADQIEAARTQPSVTYIEGDRRVEFHTPSEGGATARGSDCTRGE